jgi:hypothetical protein
VLWLLLILAAVVTLILVIALGVPQRPASRNRTTTHSDLDAESEAFRGHPPGGGTGGI